MSDRPNIYTSDAAHSVSGRITGGSSMHDKEIDVGPHTHRWRVVRCDGVRDICECAHCGKQSGFRCDFDEEYS